MRPSHTHACKPCRPSSSVHVHVFMRSTSYPPWQHIPCSFIARIAGNVNQLPDVLLDFRVQDDGAAQLTQHVDSCWAEVEGECGEVGKAVQVVLGHELHGEGSSSRGGEGSA